SRATRARLLDARCATCAPRRLATAAVTCHRVRVSTDTIDIAGWPEPARATTDAGLQVAALERPGPVVALRLTVGTGARHGAPGAAHMLEHLLFRSSEGADARRQIEQLGGEVGATTTREQISLDVIVVPDDLPAALAALARLVAVQPTATDLERERDVVV